jgi:hypothetical protein
MAKVVKKQRVPRTRNAGTSTEAEFWSMLRSALRGRSMFWKPIHVAKMNARSKYTGPNKRQKYHYLCNHCKKYFKESEIAVDHILPAGSLRCGEDLKGFVERLFCEADGFQVLCNTGIGSCHYVKTQTERKDGRKSKKA